MSNIENYVEILTVLKTFNTIKEEQQFAWREGKYGMSTHEMELFKIISESKNPEQAVLTAIKVFAAFLEQPLESQELQAVSPQESA